MAQAKIRLRQPCSAGIGSFQVSEFDTIKRRGGGGGYSQGDDILQVGVRVEVGSCPDRVEGEGTGELSAVLGLRGVEGVVWPLVYCSSAHWSCQRAGGCHAFRFLQVYFLMFRVLMPEGDAAIQVFFFVLRLACGRPLPLCSRKRVSRILGSPKTLLACLSGVRVAKLYLHSVVLEPPVVTILLCC